MPVGTANLHALLSRQRLRHRKKDTKLDIEESVRPMDVFKSVWKHDVAAGAYYTRQALVPLTRSADFVFGTNGLPVASVKKGGVVGGVVTVAAGFGILGAQPGLLLSFALAGGLTQLSALVGAVPKALGSAIGAGGGAVVGLPHAMVAAHQQSVNPKAIKRRSPPVAVGDNVFTAIIENCSTFLAANEELTDLLGFLKAMNGPAVNYSVRGIEFVPTGADGTMKEFVQRTLGERKYIFTLVLNGGKQTIHGENTTNPGLFIAESVGAFERAMTEAFALGASRRSFTKLHKLLRELSDGCYDAKVTALNKYLLKKDLCDIDGDEFKYDFKGKESDLDRAAEIARVSRLKALQACRRSLGIAPDEEDYDVTARPEFAQRFFNPALFERELKANGMFQARSEADLKEIVRQLDDDLVMFG